MSKDLKIIRSTNNYSLVQKGRMYFIDNESDVTDYMDKCDALPFITASDLEFELLCAKQFD